MQLIKTAMDKKMDKNWPEMALIISINKIVLYR